MKKFLNFILKVFTPTPFKMGVIIVLIFTYIAYKYYDTPDHEKEQNYLTKQLYMLHLKSIDERMVSRGERPVSDNIVLAVVDENSLEKLGRWPWPRNIIANMVTELKKYNVRTIGFDVLFSESEHDTTKDVLLDIKKKSKSSDLNQFIEKKIFDSDNDRIFAESIAAASDNVILGGYYEKSYDYEPFQEFCAEKLDMISPEYVHIENQELPMVSSDTSNVKVPEGLSSLVVKSLQKIEQDIRDKNTNLSEIELRFLITKKSEEFCLSFLNDESNIKWVAKFWPQLQKDDPEIQNVGFDQWLDTYKNAVLRDPIDRAGRFWINIPKLSEQSKYFGYFNAFQDSDGYIRRTKLFTRFGSLLAQSIALRTFSVLKQGNPVAYFEKDPNNPTHKMFEELRVIDAETDKIIETIPLDGKGNLYINYYGKQMTFPHISIAEILNKKETMLIKKRLDGNVKEYEVNKKDFFKDKLVFVGATATGIYDLRVTPFQENFPGLETHANVLENILAGDYLLQSNNEPIGMLLFIFIGGLIFSYIISKMSAIPGFLLIILSCFGLIYADWIFFFNKGIVLCILLPLFTFTFIYTFLTFYKYLTEERKKKELKSTFEKYVSPSIVNEILSDPDKLSLGGRKEHMTVMFSDVRGFTTLSEKLDPEVLSDFLNKYLTPMTRLIFKNNGTLDKYMGDAIMAFFGAPVAYKDHAIKSCQTALEMIDKLNELNNEFQKAQLPPIDIGIGINTGDMSVGNMGSDIVRSYTVMGDNVNLASRLEGINKTYGTRLIISESTKNEIKDSFTTRELDWVRVKGKLLPVKIFELVGGKKISEDKSKIVDHFSKGFKLYIDKKFAEALEEFNRTLNIDPNDGPSQLYIERCQEFIQNPPPENWDGVYEFLTK